MNTNSQPICFYPNVMSNYYIKNALANLHSNKALFTALMLTSIAVTMITATLIIPIILRIESNKEKVFFIYAELSKNDIDDRKRSIKIFFAKLRQSTNNPGGSLFY